MAQIVPLSPAEVAGLVEQRRLLAALRKRGDERCDILWNWQGDKLKRIIIKDYSILIEAD